MLWQWEAGTGQADGFSTRNLLNVLKTLEFIKRWVRVSGAMPGGAIQTIRNLMGAPVRLAVVKATRGVAQRPRRDQSRPV
jgi:hypothetical protein